MKEPKKNFCGNLYISTLINCHALLFAIHDISRGKTQILFVLPSSFSHGRAKFSGWAKQRKGRLPFLGMTSYRGDSRSTRRSFHFLKGRQRKIAKARFTG